MLTSKTETSPWRWGTMPKKERFTTSYKGVYYVESVDPATNKPDRIYYIRFKRDE